MTKKKKRIDKTGKQYIVFFDSEIDLSWTMSEVEKICNLWNEGVSVMDISSMFDRYPLEVVLLIIDLAEQDKIVKRPSGIFGM